MDKRTFNLHHWFMKHDSQYYWMPSNKERLYYLNNPETSFIAQGNFDYRTNHKKDKLKEENEESEDSIL